VLATDVASRRHGPEMSVRRAIVTRFFNEARDDVSL
jgi:hypothetical protein